MANLKRAVHCDILTARTFGFKRVFVMLCLLLSATVVLCLSPSQARLDTPDVYAIKDDC
jgi:hypothetical protein